MSAAAVNDLRSRIKDAGGCNANMCFAIDGSGSISTAEFNNQKNFVLDLVSVLADDETVEVAACQYGSFVSPIQWLTVDTARFNLAVERANQVRGQSFVARGVNYCISQLRCRYGEANKIVLLGDGRSNVVASAAASANEFRRIGGSVCAVGAGFKNNKALLQIAGGNKDLVFQADSFLDVLKLQSFIERLVSQICGM